MRLALVSASLVNKTLPKTSCKFSEIYIYFDAVQIIYFKNDKHEHSLTVALIAYIDLRHVG